MGISDSNKTYNDDQSAVADIVNSSGVNTAITVGTSAVEAKVGASILTGRKCLTVFNSGTATIYYGFSNGVTTSNGTPIFKNQQVTFSIGDIVSVWLIAATSGHNIRITESS
jgi:hypothetical protein